MSFNKNNPNRMGKIMGYLKQLSTDMSGGEQQRRNQSDEERLYKSRGAKYARVPSKATLSASTTCTSLATSCGSSATLAPNVYATIPEQLHSTESSSDDEQETFEKTRLHFQQLRQISLGNEYKYKMEMEIKSAKDENLRNSVPFVKQLSTDSAKVKGDYSINGDCPPYAPTTQRLYLYTQVLAAFALSMGSMIVGFASGYTSPALASMRNSTIEITKEQESWVGGLMPLAALGGGICGGPLIDYLGRRNTITGIAVPFFIGWMLIANANMVELVLAGRALCGVCVGIGSLAFPVYLAEAVQREVRGILGLLPTAFGNIGILLCSVAGPYLDWSQLAFFGAALPIPFIILMLIIPESPNWYMARGRVDDARKALQWLRGKKANVEREIRDIALAKADSERAGGSGLFQLKYARAVLVSLGLMLFQQLTGINAVIFYTKDIFSQVGSTAISDNLSAIIVGLVNFSSTFLATVLIDRLGRKILLYISSISVILTLLSLGAYFYLKIELGMDVTTIGWLPLASVIIYVLGFSLGFGPIPWLMMGEILPASIRGSAASVATAFNWMCTFFVTKTFPTINEAIGLHGTFWMFSCITVLGLFFVIFFVPETRGKSLEEIESKLTGGPSRRMSSIANMKPLPNGC